VLCGVASQTRLLTAADWLAQRGIRCVLFCEPDRGGEATALATEPLSGDHRAPLARFACLRADDLCPQSVPNAEEKPRGFAADGRSVS
jgi:hypothetical protein